MRGALGTIATLCRKIIISRSTPNFYFDLEEEKKEGKFAYFNRIIILFNEI
jgi:hypothetical protein